MNDLSSIQKMLFSACGSLLSPGGSRGALLVLMYHRVMPQPDPLLADEPDARLFAAHMDLVRSAFNVIGLTEAIERLRTGSLPPRAACITFDDGYANNFEVALPILAARKLPATVFVTTQFITGGRMWNDTVVEVVRRAGGDLDLSRFGLGSYSLTDMSARRASLDAILRVVKYLAPVERLRTVEAIAAQCDVELPRNMMLTEEQIRGLHGAGIEIGAHTFSHPILAKISEAQAKDEIAGSKSTLQDIVGAPVTTFAYPNGRPHTDYDRQHVELVRACGYRSAVSTAWGCARRDSDLFQVPRIAPWDRSAGRFAARMLSTYVRGTAQTV